VTKQYEDISTRLLDSDLVIARDRGHLIYVPSFNTVIKYMDDSTCTPILTDLIRLSALPLKDLEEVFAVDSSGLTQVLYSSWFDFRFGDNPEKKAHEWLKIHLICGVKSHIVTHIVVTDGTASDYPQLPELVKETAKNFRIREVCADKGYSGRSNHDAIASVGAVPFIPFRSNATGEAKGSPTWTALYHFFQLHRTEFDQHYHQRSNVESLFSALKRRFDGKLMFKTEVGQINETLSRILCHNITVLIKEYYTNCTEPEFQKYAHLFDALNIK
jgi:transposase